jgi:homoserine dehydrogenase
VAWFDDPVALAASDDIDMYLEMIGGADGVAKASVVAALQAGKMVVTANKAMLAHHGAELSRLAESTEGASLHYEAAVAGGIPAIKALREGMTANGVTRVSGILNGTCNYILTEMEETGAAFGGVLADAQRLGYAEADPEADVGGFDAAHKLALLAAIAFGQEVDFDAVEITGIESVAAEDIAFAGELGYRIRLLGVAEQTDAGVSQRMRPCLTPKNSPLGKIEGVTNAVMIEGDAIGSTMLIGPGAGGGPTASAVIADVVDAARGNTPPTFGLSSSNGLSAPNAAPKGGDHGEFYLRLSLADRPGALAEIATALGSESVSIHRMRQYDHKGDAAPVAIVTHETGESNLNRAIERIAALDVSLDAPVSMRIVSI